MTGADPFPAVIEYCVIEYAPGLFAPVVSRDGKWEFHGGRVFSSRESAEQGAEAEIDHLRKYWGGQVERRDRAAVVGGVHYRLGTKTANTRPEHRGSYGAMVYLRDLATGEVTDCADLWRQGEIPDFARPFLPDTHEFTKDAS